MMKEVAVCYFMFYVLKCHIMSPSFWIWSTDPSTAEQNCSVISRIDEANWIDLLAYLDGRQIMWPEENTCALLLMTICSTIRVCISLKYKLLRNVSSFHYCLKRTATISLNAVILMKNNCEKWGEGVRYGKGEQLVTLQMITSSTTARRWKQLSRLTIFSCLLS